MQDKKTDDLRQELMNAPNIETYLQNNRIALAERSIAELLMEYYGKQTDTKAVLAKRSGMSEVYLHQVFSGRRKPSRDRLLCLCIGMHLTMQDTQKLLKRAAFAPLYPRSRRDSIVIYGITHHIALDEINDTLFQENEKTLF